MIQFEGEKCAKSLYREKPFSAPFSDGPFSPFEAAHANHLKTHINTRAYMHAYIHTYFKFKKE